MLNTFSYGSDLSQLPKRDNLHIKDKRPAPNFPVIRKFYILYIAIVLINKILTHNEGLDDRGTIKILKYYYYF